ncbi:hypothetical protein L218DRAFT_393710 [Marasmius fiardii PR-910]|nr:hypothetical protein L218DRAFT_393710 [Marasmius fiardii PR-910]
MPYKFNWTRITVSSSRSMLCFKAMLASLTIIALIPDPLSLLVMSNLVILVVFRISVTNTSSNSNEQFSSLSPPYEMQLRERSAPLRAILPRNPAFGHSSGSYSSSLIKDLLRNLDFKCEPDGPLTNTWKEYGRNKW